MLIIGLGYKKQQGKDTLARAWKALLPDRIHVLAFADALRGEVHAAFAHYAMSFDVDIYNCGTEHLRELWTYFTEATVPSAYLNDPATDWDGSVVFEDPNTTQYPFGKCRVPLQWWGTEYRRAQNPDYWVDKLAERISHNSSENQVFVITDVRFENEANYVRNNGGVMVRMRRTDGVVFNDNHPSEHALDHYRFDYTFYNASVEELIHNAQRRLELILTTRGQRSWR